jgi:hypothetical protein
MDHVAERGGLDEQDVGHGRKPAASYTQVFRFRSSPQLAARSDANFGIKGTLATL